MKNVETCLRCMSCNVREQPGPALSTPRQHPSPEIHLFRATLNHSPGTDGKRKIEHYDRVGAMQPDPNLVIGAEIAVHDPPLARCKPMLGLDPFMRMHW